MNQLSTFVKPELPTKIEDLTKFVLIGREKLTSVKAEIRAINKLDLAKEVREQKREEAQMLAEALLDAEARIGEMLKELPKNNPNKRIDSTVDSFQKPKMQVVKELGFNQKQAERFETLADNKDIIEQVKIEAKEKDELPTRTEVLKRVEEAKKPHVSHNSGNNEWYTPAEYIEIARKVMGEIDVDPASCQFANKTIKAKTFYTIDDDGLKKQWFGNIWMNPPYAQPQITQFAEKLISEIDNGNVKQACVLVNNATETAWFQILLSKANAVWFIKSRIRFIDTNGVQSQAPLQGQCFLYFGDNAKELAEVTGGVIYERKVWD